MWWRHNLQKKKGGGWQHVRFSDIGWSLIAGCVLAIFPRLPSLSTFWYTLTSVCRNSMFRHLASSLSFVWMVALITRLGATTICSLIDFSQRYLFLRNRKPTHIFTITQGELTTVNMLIASTQCQGFCYRPSCSRYALVIFAVSHGSYMFLLNFIVVHKYPRVPNGAFISAWLRGVEGIVGTGTA